MKEVHPSSQGGRRLHQDCCHREPLITIITVVFRAREELQNILSNLDAFDREEFELIVIDGDSQDGTLELLRQWDAKIDYWLSEPDSGIYDAMNKAIAIAQGEYLYHLNAGDVLLYLPTRELRAAAKENIDIASFRVKIDTGQIFNPQKGRTLRYRNTLHHQGTFYRRASFIGYNCEYRIFADFDLNQRMVFSGAKVGLFDRIIASYSTDGISGNANTDEVLSIVRKNCGIGSAFMSYLLHLIYRKNGVLTRISRGIRKIS